MKLCFFNIANLSLNEVLRKIKDTIPSIGLTTAEANFKAEFIIEELVTNSFLHGLPQSTRIDLKIEIQLDPFVIIYYEIGNNRINLSPIITSDHREMQDDELLQGGGLGMKLIQQISAKVELVEEREKLSKIYTILI